jgi:hypothetical protein
VVAIFVMIVGILGLFELINQTYSYTSVNSTNLMAAYLGKEGIEIVKNIRDSNFLKIQDGQAANWDDGLANCLHGCEVDYTTTSDTMRYNVEDGDFLLWDPDLGLWNYHSGTPGPYKRIITVTYGPDVGEINVKVEITWSERNRSHNLVVQENLYQWVQ